METVFRISNCSVENQIKFSTCTLLAGALTWWNSHVRIVGYDVAYAMTWTDLRKKMTDKYSPRNEMKKLEAELWNFKVKGTDVTRYNQRFQELALLCVRIFPEESDKVERTDCGPVHYAAGTGEEKEYSGTLPCWQQRASFIIMALMRCKMIKSATRVGHLTRDCGVLLCSKLSKILTCYECGNQGHYKSDCPKLRTETMENQAEGTGTHGMVSPWKGVVRFGKRGKLNPRDAGPFKALARVEALAYKLSCLETVPLDGLHLDDKLHFVEEPLEIVGREVKRLKRSRIPLVKVRWNSKRGPEFTWEREDQFKKKYPHLFTKSAPSSSAASFMRCKSCMGETWNTVNLYIVFVVLDDDMALEDSSKQGRMIEEIDQDVGFTLVTPIKVSSQEDQPEDHLGVLSAAKVLADAAKVYTYSRRRRAVSTGSGGVSTVSRIVSTTGMIQQLKQRQERAGYEATIRLQEQLNEEESQRIARDAEIAQRLQEEINATKKQRMAQVNQATQGFIEDEWEDIRARVEADEELT
ncbi:putative reverse transcriptase domain-containing protein [Tanacetum coccineum]|uniref:Reverse transcriptase domain-containing protein n=1 Tax=Tanacetum coccineum TaxID=301880 RepID=A0ABQ5EQM4_9ASTR